MGEDQPALVDFDRRAAIADLHEFPGVCGLHDPDRVVPGERGIAGGVPQVFVVVAEQRGELAADLAREQRHALAARHRPFDRVHVEQAEIVGLEQFLPRAFGADGGIAAHIGGAAVVLAELDEAQVLDPAALAGDDGEQHGFGRLARVAAVELHQGLGADLAD